MGTSNFERFLSDTENRDDIFKIYQINKSSKTNDSLGIHLIRKNRKCICVVIYFIVSTFHILLLFGWTFSFGRFFKLFTRRYLRRINIY